MTYRHACFIGGLQGGGHLLRVLQASPGAELNATPVTPILGQGHGTSSHINAGVACECEGGIDSRF